MNDLEKARVVVAHLEAMVADPANRLPPPNTNEALRSISSLLKHERRRLAALEIQEGGYYQDPIAGNCFGHHGLKVIEKIEERLNKLEAAQAPDTPKVWSNTTPKGWAATKSRTIKLDIDTTEVMKKVEELRQALAGLTVKTVEGNGESDV